MMFYTARRLPLIHKSNFIYIQQKKLSGNCRDWQLVQFPFIGKVGQFVEPLFIVLDSQELGNRIVGFRHGSFVTIIKVAAHIDDLVLFELLDGCAAFANDVIVSAAFYEYTAGFTVDLELVIVQQVLKKCLCGQFGLLAFQVLPDFIDFSLVLIS